MSTFADYELRCPMPDCTDLLYITWEQSYALAPEDLVADGSDNKPLPVPSGAHSGTWQVECAAGHVLLQPGDTGCPCNEDQSGPNCPHDESDYDWSEDDRTFRAHDAKRLRVLLIQLANLPMVCHDCGCTDNDACPQGCWWAEPYICSTCVPTEAAMSG